MELSELILTRSHKQLQNATIGDVIEALILLNPSSSSAGGLTDGRWNDLYLALSSIVNDSLLTTSYTQATANNTYSAQVYLNSINTLSGLIRDAVESSASNLMLIEAKQEFIQSNTYNASVRGSDLVALATTLNTLMVAQNDSPLVIKQGSSNLFRRQITADLNNSLVTGAPASIEEIVLAIAGSGTLKIYDRSTPAVVGTTVPTMVYNIGNGHTVITPRYLMTCANGIALSFHGPNGVGDTNTSASTATGVIQFNFKS